jgi:hypothetical protein
MKRVLAGSIGTIAVVSGLVMLAAGRWFYATTPGVAETGPYNPHFVRDIGAAYLTAGAGLIALAWRASPVTRSAAISGALFLALHAAIHLAEAAGAPAGLADLSRDFPGVILPAMLAAWSVWPSSTRLETHHA